MIAQIPRSVNAKKDFFQKDFPKYNSELSTEDKICILNALLPDYYNIYVSEEEISVFDTIGEYLYKDNSETPVEVLIDYYMLEFQNNKILK